MNRILTAARAAVVLAGTTLALPLPAQSRLYVLEPDGNYHAVFAVQHEVPVIKSKAGLVPATGQRLMLKKVEEFVPLLVEVAGQNVGTTYLDVMNVNPAQPMRVNNEFHYSATFESSVLLENVFLVLELEFAHAGRRFYPHEVGRLDAWTPRRIEVNTLLEEALGAGKFILHVFVGGSEILHTAMPPEGREAALDAMVAQRVKGVAQGEPKLLFGSAPRYPAGFRESGIKGDAVVALRVSARGAVVDPQVESASDPAFGEAALAAVRQWRFVPRVAGGRPVESSVRLPVAFDPAQGGPKAN